MKAYDMQVHTFVVPAYGCSPHLEACLRSLSEQTIPSQLILSTSTPSEQLEKLANDYGFRYVVHSPNQGIAHDWNVGLSHADTEWVTLAHQDDVYYPDFAKRTLAAAIAYADAMLIFTNYDELEAGAVRPKSRLLVMKQLLLEIGFLGRVRVGSRTGKTNALRFGCAIPCPSVTINMRMSALRFDLDLKIDLDWAAWLTLAERQGAFVWVRGEPCMGHRIHESSETTAGILDGRRQQEDLQLLSRLWPLPIARLIAKTYSIAYAGNRPPDIE